MYRLLTSLCPEQQVKDRLWNEFLLDELMSLYKKAMDHAHFLLNIERGGIPCTFNHSFSSTLQERRHDRVVSALEKLGICAKGETGLYARIADVKDSISDKSNDEQVCEDIFDALLSYYRVSRKRFVDVVCQQVIFHLLLQSKDSPLNFFSPELIMGLGVEELDAIAGEDEDSKQTRHSLEREIMNLEAALKLLRV